VLYMSNHYSSGAFSMNVRNQSSGVRRTAVVATLDWGIAATQFDGREPEPEPVEDTRCGACKPNGFQVTGDRDADDVYRAQG